MTHWETVRPHLQREMSQRGEAAFNSCLIEPIRNQNIEPPLPTVASERKLGSHHCNLGERWSILSLLSQEASSNLDKVWPLRQALWTARREWLV
jgi:hypothetical protein